MIKDFTLIFIPVFSDFLLTITPQIREKSLLITLYLIRNNCKFYLENKKEIRIGTLKDNLPFSEQNEETQKPMGIIVDWISHLKNTLGLSETNVNYIFFSHQEELENALLENTVDLIFPVSAKTSNKKNQIIYKNKLKLT